MDYRQWITDLNTFPFTPTLPGFVYVFELSHNLPQSPHRKNPYIRRLRLPPPPLRWLKRPRPHITEKRSRQDWAHEFTANYAEKYRYTSTADVEFDKEQSELKEVVYNWSRQNVTILMIQVKTITPISVPTECFYMYIYYWPKSACWFAGVITTREGFDWCVLV